MSKKYTVISDDIIDEATLYDYVCRLEFELDQQNVLEKVDVEAVILDCIANFKENRAEAKKKLINSLKIILLSYRAVKMKELAVSMISNLKG